MRKPSEVFSAKFFKTRFRESVPRAVGARARPRPGAAVMGRIRDAAEGVVGEERRLRDGARIEGWFGGGDGRRSLGREGADNLCIGMLPAGLRRQPKARSPASLQAGCIPAPLSSKPTPSPCCFEPALRSSPLNSPVTKSPSVQAVSGVIMTSVGVSPSMAETIAIARSEPV